MSQYENGWQGARERIEAAARTAGRPAGSVALLAVSKTFPPEAVEAVYRLGQRAFGENYVQEAAEKRARLAHLPGLAWVLVGPLQGNKARLAAEVFDRVESVDRAAVARRLAAARPAGRGPLEVLVQVNISGEVTKSGVAPDAALPLAREVAAVPGLAFRGFMGIAEPTPDPARQRAQFAVLRGCGEAARAEGLPAEELSMGMSGDLEAAVAEGATEVRLGTAIFGARAPRHGERAA